LQADVDLSMKWSAHSVLPSVLFAASNVACAEDSRIQVLGPSAPPSIAVHFDNDLLSGMSRDQDYSWGMTLTFASPQTSRMLAPVDRVREGLHTILDWADAEGAPSAAAQLGLLAMTPSTLTTSEPIKGDRPYASLLFVVTSAMEVLDGGKGAMFTSFTVGALGLNVAGSLQRMVHRTLDDDMPMGWDQQISDGGEPTARYVQARQWQLGNAAESGDPSEWKLTLSGSGGYLSEAVVAVSGRWGRFDSPWWSFAPELGDYTSAPLAPLLQPGPRTQRELFAFAGVRFKARLYNALLQGQFRHSDVRVAVDDLARLLLDGWIGVAGTWSDMRISYTMHYGSPEITSEPGRRSAIWAGISFEKSF
jgi:hypothetical protein